MCLIYLKIHQIIEIVDEQPHIVYKNIYSSVTLIC